MRLITKTTLHLGISAALMIAVLLGVSLPFLNQMTARAIQPHSETVATMARDILTLGMVQGDLTASRQLVRNLVGRHGIETLRVVPGPAVTGQFRGGEGAEPAPTALEAAVLASGAPRFASDLPDAPGLFTAVIPYVAEPNSNCLDCHRVEPGTVLGVVTVQVSEAAHRRAARTATLAIIVTIALSALVAVFYFRRVLAPVTSTAEEVETATERARQGDFRTEIRERTDDEIGHIATSMNHLLGFLKRSFNDLNTKVADLIQVPAHASGNLLLATTELVENLIATAQFKQVIEEDENREEVYGRLGEVIQGPFHHHQFSLYEVDGRKNRLVPVLVDGERTEQCKWCDPQVLVRGDACRARRTGHVVRSTCEPGICPAFRPDPESGVSEHVCIPINQSGAVGNVVQLLGDRDTIGLTELYVPFIQMYLREAAPVIESKRLMDTLRETTLRDPMTGLHNRRFLEEFITMLVAQTDRAKSRFSVLMADLDYFKKVNDAYGHEAGDKVLVALARTLSQAVRGSDLVIRYGGEEFLVVVRDTEPGGGDAVAEKLREAVEALRIHVPGAELRKTLSIGVADYPDDSGSFWQVVKYADVALYRAKEQGRNRVLHFTPEMWEGSQDDY